LNELFFSFNLFCLKHYRIVALTHYQFTHSPIQNTLIMRPKENEYAPFYHTYVGKVPDGEILTNLRHIHHETQELVANLSEEKGDYRYADGKWTIKEVLMHLIDTEQVMAYRALRVARNDKTPLPGFDQNLFAESIDVSDRTLKGLAEEYAITRDLTHYIIMGHEIHHRKVLIEKYLNG